MEGTATDSLLSGAVILYAAVFLVVVLRVMVASTHAYVDVQAASLGSAQCDGGGLERERANWQLVYGTVGDKSSGDPMDDATANGGPVLDRALKVFTNTFRATDTVVFTFGAIGVIIAVLLALSAKAEFKSTDDYSKFCNYQLEQHTEYGKYLTLPGINNTLYGFLPKEWYVWMYSLQKGLNFGPDGKWTDRNYVGQIPFIVMYIITMFIRAFLWIFCRLSMTFWYFAIGLKGTGEPGSMNWSANYGFISAMVLVAIMALYAGLRRGAALTEDSDKVKGLRNEVEQYRNIYVAPMAVEWDKALKQALGDKYSSLDTIGFSDIKDALKTNSEAGNKKASIVLDWLNRLQGALQLSDADMTPVHVAMQNFVKHNGVLDMSVENTSKDVAEMVGYLMNDQEWVATLKKDAPVLSQKLEALRTYTGVETEFRKYFRRAVVTSVVVLSVAAYLVALRWHDSAMYTLLLGILGMGGLSALLYVVLHVVRTV